MPNRSYWAAKFDPLEDITAYELALIQKYHTVGMRSISDHTVPKLGTAIRHFICNEYYNENNTIRNDPIYGKRMDEVPRIMTYQSLSNEVA